MKSRASAHLRPDALARRAVVVRARLPIFRRVHRQPLVLHALALPLQRLELPAHEGVVVGVDVGGDEGPAPVDAAAEVGEVALRDRREVLQPVQRVPAWERRCLYQGGRGARMWVARWAVSTAARL